MDGAIPGQVVVGCIIQQAVQDMKSMPISIIPLWPLYQFLPVVQSFLPSVMEYDLKVVV